LQAWYPGVEGGTAVAEVLFGEYNPAGRLPVTFYADTKDLPPFDDYSMKNRTYRYFNGKPEFPFGHGLSYTSFSYGPIKARSINLTANETLDFGVRLQNTGQRDGEEVVQVYFRHLSSKLEQPIRSLIGFRRVKLAAGAAAPVEFSIPVERLHYWNENGKTYAVETGDYLIELGKSSADIQQSIKIHVD
jgi:beta-glucosidase